MPFKSLVNAKHNNKIELLRNKINPVDTSESERTSGSELVGHSVVAQPRAGISNSTFGNSKLTLHVSGTRNIGTMTGNTTERVV